MEYRQFALGLFGVTLGAQARCHLLAGRGGRPIPAAGLLMPTPAQKTKSMPFRHMTAATPVFAFATLFLRFHSKQVAAIRALYILFRPAVGATVSLARRRAKAS